MIKTEKSRGLFIKNPGLLFYRFSQTLYSLLWNAKSIIKIFLPEDNRFLLLVLHFIESGEKAVFFEQLFSRPLFGDPVFIDDDDPIRIANRG